MANELFIAKNAKDALSYIKKGATVLAGGTEINRLDSLVKAKNLVSIGRIEGFDKISRVSVSENKFLRVGATCTFQEAIESKTVPQYFKNACLYMSSRTKRNMATIGGNIAIMRDDSYLWSTLLASGAYLEIMNKSGKVLQIPCEEYLTNEVQYIPCLILAVLLRTAKVNVVAKRYANTAASHAYITMAIGKNGKEYRVGLCIKNEGIYFLDDIDVIKEIKTKDDMFGSKEYKSYLLGVTSEDLVKSLGGAK